jgi:hypothetical protein
MKESFVQPEIDEAVDKKLQEKILRQTLVPNGAGLRYGELYDTALRNNDGVEPGESFLEFHKRIEESQPKSEKFEPIDSYREAA